MHLYCDSRVSKLLKPSIMLYAIGPFAQDPATRRYAHVAKTRLSKSGLIRTAAIDVLGKKLRF